MFLNNLKVALIIIFYEFALQLLFCKSSPLTRIEVQALCIDQILKDVALLLQTLGLAEHGQQLLDFRILKGLVGTAIMPRRRGQMDPRQIALERGLMRRCARLHLVHGWSTLQAAAYFRTV